MILEPAMSWKTAFETILVASAVTLLTYPRASAETLTVINPNFSVPVVQCGSGFAYQTWGGNCQTPAFPQQDFNNSTGIGWTFTPHPRYAGGSRLTLPDSGFNPPPFSGLPFPQAALLQDVNSEVSQTITGFVPGGLYTLSFYLGSRYRSDIVGNQLVQVTIDDHVIGAWDLNTFVPFTLQTVPFTISLGGSHVLKFAGVRIRADSLADWRIPRRCHRQSECAWPVATSAVWYPRPSGYRRAKPDGCVRARLRESSNSDASHKRPRWRSDLCLRDGICTKRAVSLTFLNTSTPLRVTAAYSNGTTRTLQFAIPPGALPGLNMVAATGIKSGVTATVPITVQ